MNAIKTASMILICFALLTGCKDKGNPYWILEQGRQALKENNSSDWFHLSKVGFDLAFDKVREKTAPYLDELKPGKSTKFHEQYYHNTEETYTDISEGGFGGPYYIYRAQCYKIELLHRGKVRHNAIVFCSDTYRRDKSGKWPHFTVEDFNKGTGSGEEHIDRECKLYGFDDDIYGSDCEQTTFW